MAKGKKTGGRDVKKGQVLNPKGRTPVPAEVRAIMSLNKETLNIWMNDVIHMPVDELQDMIKDKREPGLKLGLVSVLIKAINEGDHARMEWLLSRLIGRMPTKVEGPNGEPLSIMAVIEMAGDD